MGAYLSAPVTEKHSEDGDGPGLSFGTSEMQGWRKNMEDQHVNPVSLDGQLVGFFAVFDGHGGREVAKFCQMHAAQELLASAEYKAGDMKGALVKTFHR